MAHNARMAKTQTFTDIIRAAAKADGRTWYALARDSGINPAVVGRFFKGERGLNLGTAEKLCRVLGLTLRPEPRGSKG